jgi:xylulose-5-phosphate/fructose-6-phosphate phosphoketolase
VSDYAVPVDRPAVEASEATRVLGTFLRDIIAANPDRFRIMGPDETASNRLSMVFEATNRAWDATTLPGDDHLSPDGRVMEVLSEHLCQGWLEGYLLTGRQGFFNCYEAFIHIIDSMFNQHAKWLETTCHPVAGADRVTELSAVLARLAPGPQRLLHQDP